MWHGALLGLYRGERSQRSEAGRQRTAHLLGDTKLVTRQGGLQAHDVFECWTSSRTDVQHEIIDCPLKATHPDERRIELFTLRLRLPEILPHLERIIFLDSDILVVDDIAKLWEIDLNGKWLGAAACLNTSDDVCLRNYNNEFQIKFKQAVDPINGGVAMLELGKMRELNIADALTGWLQANRDQIYNPDQEAISMHCGGQFTVLPPEWNFRLFAEQYWTSSWHGYREYIKLKPSIVHFQNPLRPNLLKGGLPYFEEWIAYYKHVMQSELVSAKRIGYFMFVYFEFYFVITLLARKIASYRWRTLIAGVLLFPYSFFKYLQYVCLPAQY